MSVDGSTQLGNISYNTATQVTQLKTGAGTSHPRIETYGYDNQTGLLTGQTVKNTSGNRTYMDMGYSYAREGNSAGTNSGSEKTGQLTKITDNRYPDHQRVYEFDALGRLKKAKGGLAAGAVDVTANWTQEYSYDRYGNKTGVTANGVDRNNTTVPADGLAAVSINTSTNRITTSGWDYDLTGNVVRGQNASGVWQRFEYDAAGRLVKIRDDSSNIIETYTYGATRERLMTETSAGRTYYVWGGQSVIAEYTETGTGTIPTFTKSYVYAGSRLLAVSYSDGLLEFHHPDRIGTQLVTFGGTIGTIRQSTYPFGTLEQGPYSNQIFTSYDRSTSTGLDYAMNRTYSSGQSRFTQVDPIGTRAASLGDPQSNNLYAYVQNMPTDFVDPLGLDGLSDAINGAAKFLKYKACADLFKGKDPGALLKKTKIRSLKNEPIGYTSKGITNWRKGWANREAVTISFGAAKGIYMNPAGAAFTGAAPNLGFGVQLSATDAAILTIIHELAHIAGVIPTDSGSDEKSFQNSKKIWEECFLKHPLWRYTVPVQTFGGGGSGGGDWYADYGGYPSWWYAQRDFLNWLYSIPIYRTDVRVLDDD